MSDLIFYSQKKFTFSDMKMKLFVAVLFFGLTAAGPLENAYLPPNSLTFSSRTPSATYGPASQNVGFRNVGPDGHSNILRFDNTNDGTGSYQYQYETENKISQQEHGELKHVGNEEVTFVQGSYSYIGDDGKTYTVNYIADENGFQPIGEHIDQAISKTAAEAKFVQPGSDSHGGFRQQSNGGYQY